MNRYYAILGLSPGSSQSEIKRAYRQKAMQFHPDRNREPDARQKFLEVLEAYEYLVGKRKQKIRAKRSAERDPEDVFEEYMRDLAKKRAREKYRERVREFRRKQAEEQSREFLRAIYVLLFLLVTGCGIYLARSIYTYINIALHPVERMAKVQHIEPRRVHFVFSYGGYTYMVDEYASKSMADMKSKTGMPLFLGDEFVVRFNAANPRHFQIQYQRPNARTLNRYMDLVDFKLMSMYYPKWTALEREERFALAQCISSEVYGQHGIEGLSHIYYSDLFPLENTAHNSISWQFFKWFKFNGIKASCQREYGLKDGL